MPLHVDVNPKEEFLHVEVSGDFVLSEAKELIRQIYDVARQHDLRRIIIDRRRMKGPVHDMDRFRLAEFVAAEQKGTTFYIGILKEEAPGGVDRFFENVAVNRGALVKVTPDLGEIFEWLGIKPPTTTATA